MRSKLHILMIAILLIPAFYVFTYAFGIFHSASTVIGVLIGTIILLGHLARFYVRRCGNSGVLGKIEKFYRRVGLLA